ncbi:MAG TPA: hydroxyacid dehydrogenase [Aggregatilinea sp.]|jgi:D-3-phosphoglycerate dehydrogenase|uniref:hydroxyacid dehydrogenase n=1 Tax=Aggregatilinea sp. TaxID=2806333 RepID=UPI002B7505A3|nr:hydroxyacid dehydrogenase [Aggregatilinea sp.]HML21308.1 hydroxyacid dehydrogenase [Aggregatilinea sp.]
MTQIVLVPDSLEDKGLQVLYNTEGVEVNAPGKMTREQTLAAVPNANALIVRSDTKVDSELLDHAPNLRFVVRAGVGVDNIDLDECTRRRVVVMNAPDGNTISTAELTFALILALARHIPAADASMRAGKWDRKKFMGTQLAGKTLGIIGFGRVGRAVAERAQAFGMTEVAYDPFVPERVARHLGLSIVPRLDDLFAEADIITLHALVTDETRGLINAENIAKMKDGVRIINAARGKLINAADLAEALKSGKVAGAALDVYDTEPPTADNPLLGLPTVIYTPHLGASTVEAQEAVAEQAAQQIVNALFNDRFDNVRNRGVFDTL